MKPAATLLAALLIASSALAADIALTDGRVLKDATITSQTPRTVTVKHAAGLSSIAKNLLPPDLQAKYPVDEAAAQIADQKAIEARKNAQALQLAEAERVARVKEQRGQNLAHQEATAKKEAGLQQTEAAKVMLSAKILAEQYFTQKHSWSPGSSTTCEVTINDARPVDGWPGRWLVTGQAVMKRYDNIQPRGGVVRNPGQPLGGVAETSVDSDTPKAVRRSNTHEHSFTYDTRSFEGTYSTEGASPSLDVTLR